MSYSPSSPNMGNTSYGGQYDTAGTAQQVDPNYGPSTTGQDCSQYQGGMIGGSVQQGQCPGCGRCRECGRPYPQYYPPFYWGQQPMYPITPLTVWC